jgi:hypothetical protein
VPSHITVAKSGTVHHSSISSVSSRYAQLPVAPFAATSADELVSPVAINPIVDAMTQLTAQLESLDTVPLDDPPPTANEPVEVLPLDANTHASYIQPLPPTSYAFNGDEHIANTFSNTLPSDAIHSSFAGSAVFVAPMATPIVPPPLVPGSSGPPSSSTCFLASLLLTILT